MKKIILGLLLCLPLIANAQDDKKYLENAVPVIDGKVTFTTEIKAPLNQQQLFEIVKNYMQKRFAENEKFPSCKVTLADASKGDLVGIGEEYIVFSSSALSLDRTRIYYMLHAECTDGSCKLDMSRIRYLYDENRDGGQRYKAEDWITDEMALNKTKTKLSRMTGKFRSNTIDLKDELFDGIEKAIAGSLLKKETKTEENVKKEDENKAVRIITAPTASVSADNTVTEQAPVEESQNKMILKKEKSPAAVEIKDIAEGKTEAKPLDDSAVSSMKGYREVKASDIPGNFYELISKDWMLITSGNKEKFNMMTASWGTFGQLYGRPVMTCYILPSRYTYQLIEKNDTYTLTFYKSNYKKALQYCGNHSGRDENKVKGSGLTPISTPDGTMAFNEAWLIVECKKILTQSFTTDAVKDEKLKAQWEGKAMHKMYIGEVLHVWMK